MLEETPRQQQFPLYEREGESSSKQILETAEEPGNKRLRQIFTVVGLLLEIIGILSIAIAINNPFYFLPELMIGVLCLIVSLASLWCANRLEKYPVVVPIYALTLTATRIILTTRRSATSARTSGGPKLRTYRSRSITGVIILTVIIPILLLVYWVTIEGGFTAELYNDILTVMTDLDFFSIYLVFAGLILLPLVVFMLVLIGRRNLKLALILSVVTFFVYHIYFNIPPMLDNIPFWISALIGSIPDALLGGLTSCIYLLSLLLLWGIIIDSFLIPLPLIGGLAFAAMIQIARTGSGRTGPSRGFSLPKRLSTGRPDDISRFWKRMETEMTMGGDYKEQDIALDALRTIQTKTTPDAVSVGKFPVKWIAILVGAITLGGAGFFYLGSLLGPYIMTASGGLFILVAMSCSADVSKSVYSLLKWGGIIIGLEIVIIFWLDSQYMGGIAAAMIIPPTAGFFFFLAIMAARSERVLKYYSAVDFVAHNGITMTPPRIIADHQSMLGRMFQELKADGLYNATVTSATFSEKGVESTSPKKRLRLGTQIHESTCSTYVRAYAEKAANLVGVTAISFPFLMIASINEYGGLFASLNLIILAFEIIMIIGISAVYSLWLLGNEQRVERFFSISQKTKMDGTLPKVFDRMVQMVFLIGAITMFYTFSWIGFWTIALVVAQLIGYAIIAGALEEVFMFGTRSGYYEGLLWIENRGMTWTIRHPIYRYETEKRGKEYVQVKYFQYYDSRGRYYLLKNAHSMMRMSTSSVRGLFKFIGVVFACGVVFYYLVIQLASIPWLGPWMFVIAIFIIGASVSYGIRNLVLTVIPAYGLFVDGRGSFDQYLSLDVEYPSVTDSTASLDKTAMSARNKP